MLDLTPHQAALLSAVRKAAREGRPCPTNAALANASGYAWEQSIPPALEILQSKGLITIRRDGNNRVITIAATGESTKGNPLAEQTPQRDVAHGAVPCWRCGSRPGACGCRA